MPILRDKARITEMLILLSIMKGRRKLKEVAEDVGITVQGVSEYMKSLESKGMVKDFQITLKGLDFLYSSLEELGDFIHEANRIIGRIRVTEAIAGEDIEEGEEVGLFMEDGYLHAYKRESSSKGVAITSAKAGEDIGVGNLKGIIDIKRGRIIVISLPPVEEGGSKVVSRERLMEFLSKHDGVKIGICGAVAKALSKDIRVDFEFASSRAAVDAAFRGISTVLLVSHEMLPYALKTILEGEVDYEVLGYRQL